MRQEQRLEAVACKRLFGAVPQRTSGLPPLFSACARLFDDLIRLEEQPRRERQPKGLV